MRFSRILAMVVAASALECEAWAQPVVSAVLNGASYSAVVAPGSWVTIFGTNLALNSQSASVSLPNALAGVSVSVGSVTAPLLYVSPNQVNALIPLEVAIPASTVVPLVVNSQGVQAKPYNLRLTRDAPGIFTRNGAGTGRALVFDAGFRAVDTVGAKDIVVLYATGLGPTDASGSVIDTVEVYIGERQAQLLSASLAPGFPGIYQLNVTAPVPATDRLYLRVGGWQSNIVDVGIRSGVNATNVAGSIDGLYPSTDPFFNLPPCVDEESTTPCNAGQTLSIMLHAASFNLSFDIVPSADPFDVAAVGTGGASVISINPAAGTYTASVSTLTLEAARGDFSKSVVPLWDYTNCDVQTLVCFAFPGPSVLPPSRIDPYWLQAIRMLPVPSATAPTSPNVIVQVSGNLSGRRLVIDGQTNTALSRFGGIVQVPLGPFDTSQSTFKLYVDGRLVTSKDFPFRVIHR
ncbi:MAG: hypothetical protein LAQ69_12855 [Acidobacteriia bacterium]|nr:hypothetical protein [Terriglobia bacterium]